MSLLRQGRAQMLTIYLGESDQWQGQQLYVALLRVFRDAGCAGATVTRAVAGYGAGAQLHEQKGWHLSLDAPVIVQVVDQPARLHRVIPRVQEMMQGGLMTLQEVDVLKYTHARRQGLSTKLPVRQVMETIVTTVDLETSAATVVELLLQAPFRVVPVVDEHHRLCGIISTGDLINAGLLPMRRGLVRQARELDTATAKAVSTDLQTALHRSRTAQEIMNPGVRTIRPEQSIREAARLMIDTQVRNLPVVEATGMLCGMVTRTDLLQAIRTSPLLSPEASSETQPLSHSQPLPDLSAQEQPVTAYLSTEIALVKEDTPLAEAIDALLMSPLKRVIVVDAAQSVKGIISDVDVLAHMQEEGRPHLLALLADWARGRPADALSGSLRVVPGRARVAADVMNAHVVTLAATATIQEAVDVMMTTHRKILPVVDQKQHFIGTVGRSDILHALLESEAE